MANDKDKIYEQIYFLWKGEGEKRNESIDWYCEKYHVKVEDFRRWYKGISKSVKEIQVIGRPGNTTTLATEDSAEESKTAKGELPGTEEPRIVITTNDAGKVSKPAIATLTINCGNGLHITRKGMSYDEFLTFAQNLKALC